MSYAPATQTQSWGRVFRPNQEIAHPAFRADLSRVLIARSATTVLPFGLQRSYGDSNLNSAGQLIDMTRLNRIISFDAQTGILRAEAGLSVSDLLMVIVPHGWFLKTTPGTRFVTLGGAVANDIHGKNHHSAGSFGNSVRRIGLLRSDGTEHELSADGDAPLFAATIGGLGLTGIITWVEIELARIPSAHVDFERVPFGSVGEFFSLAREAALTHEHTVAWIDCVGAAGRGRGIFQKANWHASASLNPHSDRSRLAVPLDAPGFLLNRYSVEWFNAFYFHLQKSGARRRIVHYAPFFYPLDAIGDWNRLYGRRGFYQYQCVIPPAGAELASENILREVTSSGAGSFLAVVKTFGAIPSRGMLSFPCQGATLAFDLPNRGAVTLALMSRLDAIVQQAGGRLYPAKDGRMSASMFRSGYPRYAEFIHHIDPAMGSDFWRRVAA